MAKRIKKGRNIAVRRPALLAKLEERYEAMSSQLVTMMLPPYVALDMIQRGKAERPQMASLALFTLFTAFLCDQGWRADALDIAHAGQRALERVCAHLDEIQWRKVAPLDSDAYAAFCATLAVLTSQIEAATPNQVIRAYIAFEQARAVPALVEAPVTTQARALEPA